MILEVKNKKQGSKNQYCKQSMNLGAANPYASAQFARCSYLLLIWECC